MCRECLCRTPTDRDHSKSIPDAIQYGLKVYSNADVAERYEGVKALEPNKRYKIGNFIVLPLVVPHGDCMNYAYHISMPDGQTLLFATDLETLPYALKGCNHIAIECNHSEAIIYDKIAQGEPTHSSYTTHMELERCITVLKRLYSSSLCSVILLHLSDSNSDERAFVSAIRERVGVDCKAADTGRVFALEQEF